MALFSMVGAAVFGAGTFLAVATATVLKLAAGIAMNLIAANRAGKQKGPSFAVNGTLQGGGDISRSIPFGWHATAGSLAWANTHGDDGDTKNALLTQVIALADMPVKGLAGIWVNSQKCTIDYSRPHPDGRGFPITEYRKDNEDNLWLKFYDGTQTAADSYCVTRASNSNAQYSGNRVGRGIAYAVMTARVSKNMFSGFPSYLFELNGMRLYDISRDSSAGGNGNQTFSDPSTWGGDGDDLPAVQLYNLMRGIRYGGSWLYGFQGITASRLPAANWINAVEKCRAISAGQTTYRSGGECPVEAPLTAATEAILTACQGQISECGGVYELFVGEPDLPEFSITDMDIISTEQQQFTPFYGLADVVTGMSGTFPSPAEAWGAKTAPPIIRPDLDQMLAGGRRMMANVPFDFVPYPEQVQRLLQSGLLDGLRQRRHTYSLPPSFMPRCKPGRTFVWTSVRNGYVSKLFRIDGVQILQDCRVLIDVTECDPDDYDWQSSDYRPQIDGPTGPLRPLPTPIYDFAAEPSAVLDDNGNPRRVAILLKWAGQVSGVDFVEYVVELSSNLTLVDNGFFVNVAAGEEKITSFALLPNTAYRVRARYGSYAGDNNFQWSQWLQVLTSDIKLGGADIYLDINVNDFNQSLIDAWVRQSENTRYLSDEIDRISTILADQTATNSILRQGMREAFSVQMGDNRAEYTRLILVEVGEREALATRVEQVLVELDEGLAEVTDFVQAKVNEIDGQITAISQAVTNVSAQVGAVSANGYFQVYAEAASSGAVSRVALTASATAGGPPVQAALFIEAMSNGRSRVSIDAEEFFVSSGAARAKPLAFINGVLTVTAAAVDVITFNEINSHNSKLKLDGRGNNASIRIFV